MRSIAAFGVGAFLAACAPTPAPDAPPALPETSLPLFGDGYPMAGDPCRRVGESPETINFLDHTQALVACPENWAGRDDFASDTSAREVLRQDGLVLYSIPLEP